MILSGNSPTLLFWFAWVLAFIGVLVLFWGEQLRSHGKWLIWGGLLLFLFGVGVDSGVIFQEEFKIKTWYSGWVLSRHEVNAITIGVFQDSFAYVFSTIACLTAFVLLLDSRFLKNSFSYRCVGALGISTAGVLLATIADTPWMMLASFVITLFGGLYSFGPGMENEQESKNAMRYLLERTIGLLVTFFGALVLITTSTHLYLSESSEWLSVAGAIPAMSIGSFLLLIGVFLQMMPFPYLSWLLADSSQMSPTRVLLNKVFPGWTAFIFLIRLEPHFQQVGLLSFLGWVGLISAFLTLCCGLFQATWRPAFNLWLVSGFSLACTFLAFSGPFSAVAILLGVSFSALIYAGVGSYRYKEAGQKVGLSPPSFLGPSKESRGLKSLQSPLSSRKKKTGKKRSKSEQSDEAASNEPPEEHISRIDPEVGHLRTFQWKRVLVFLAAAAGTGIFGFVSATGGVQGLGNVLENPGFFVPFLFVFCLFAFLGWRLAFTAIRCFYFSSEPATVLVSPILLVVLSLGLVWTGKVTGNVIPGLSDQAFRSLLEVMFQGKSTLSTGPSELLPAVLLYWGGLLLVILLAYWSSGRKVDRLESLASQLPQFSRFIASGYQMERVWKGFAGGMRWLGDASVSFWDQRFWSNWIPSGFGLGIQGVSRRASRMDQVVFRVITESIRRLIEVPAKTLQLIHTGDLRWYLVFALGFGFAILFHYLRT